MDVLRRDRRIVSALERKERASGHWSAWNMKSRGEIAAALERMDAKFGNTGGWARQVHTVWTNGWMSVSVRTVKVSPEFEVDHAFYTTASETELTWPEKQRLKLALFGPDRTAIEVFPRSEDLIDAANVYHLWVFPPGFRFDFGLGTGQL